MGFWLAVQKIYNLAADLFDRGVSARVFSLLFFGLAGLELVVGLAINAGLMTKIGLAIDLGFAFSPVILPVLILVATVLWLTCFILQDKRRAIQSWIREKLLLLYSVPSVTIPNPHTSFKSTTPYTEAEPPRSTPRAKS